MIIIIRSPPDLRRRVPYLRILKPRLNRVNRCPPFQTSCFSDSRHQGGIAHPSALAIQVFSCHFLISWSYAFGPKAAAIARAFNAFLPGYDRRFVINDRKLMNAACQ
jgi:hypothetical protein